MRAGPDAILIFAAGFGTRMGALTRDRPKPLIEVGGRALLDHAIALARAAGIGRIAVNAHYMADRIEAHLAGTGIAVSREAPEILDTGGGLRAALPLLGPGPVFTLNSDAVWTGSNPLAGLRQAWAARPGGALLSLIPSTEALGHPGRGDFALDASGRLRRGGGLVYTGAQIVDPAGLETFPGPAFSLNRHWDALAARGALHGVLHEGGWCDVGRPESLTLAEALLAGAADV